ncbi:MAG: hypothetical protein HC901_03360 [Bdellovibrionaceae bacterium]|nr:hypothetical protein [Pseudobdellovibrionaceae bacterium]
MAVEQGFDLGIVDGHDGQVAHDIGGDLLGDAAVVDDDLAAAQVGLQSGVELGHDDEGDDQQEGASGKEPVEALKPNHGELGVAESPRGRQGRFLGSAQPGFLYLRKFK